MANDFFSFKQFTVYHSRCAMKVGTDGVLLGAWAGADGVHNILDIGTGTGLLALMLAQRNSEATIKAIDIDADAIWQAEDNIARSPFSDRIYCEHVSLSAFGSISKSTFDLIVSNPPFFENSLKSPDKQRSLARHTDTLPLEELLRLSSALLSPRGRLSLVYPYHRKEQIIELAEANNLSVSRIANVYPTPTASPRRVLLELNKAATALLSETDLIIETQRHVYSADFVVLLKDFYLKF